MFPTLSNLVTGADANIKELLHIISQYLKDLANTFEYDFPEHEVKMQIHANVICENESRLEICCEILCCPEIKKDHGLNSGYILSAYPPVSRK